MRRADRLFKLINLLRRRRRAVTARQLAETLEVSERTIYRDIQALSLANVPIEGEAGVGYLLQKHYDLPPLMFETDEVEALLFGARMVQAWSDRKLAASASSAMQKILAILPEHLRGSEDETGLVVPDFGDDRYRAFSEEIRAAIKAKQVISMGYQREDGQSSTRKVQPLGLVFWGRTWTLVAWCELRSDYRAFRLDRIVKLKVTDNQFTPAANKNLSHYLDLMSKCSD